MRQIKTREDITHNVMIANEADANKSFSIACVFTAGVLLILWIMYMTGLFLAAEYTMLLVNITFPISIVLMLSTVIYTKTKLIEKPGFKYFLLFQFVIIIAILNIALPKHTMMAWILCIIITNHYYSPKVTGIITLACVILCPICLYGGMFLGEFDTNLFNVANEVTLGGETIKVDFLTAAQRFEFLVSKIDTDNRFVKAALFYVLPREIIMAIAYVICVTLAKRTKNLIIAETEQVMANQKFTTEITFASELQKNVLPAQYFLYDNVEVVARMTPAKNVGGDFYSYFLLDNDNIALAIADVSGKGYPASLYMMKADTVLKSLSLTLKENISPADILRRVNASLCDGNKMNLFVTCWFGILNKKTGHLVYSNAGHNPPLICHDGKFSYLSKSKSVVLGAINNMHYVDESLDLSSGDKVFLYTDGVTETHNEDNELYGEARLLNFLNNNAETSLRNLPEILSNDLKTFANGRDQFDDITMLMVQYQKEAYNKEEFEIDAETSELDSIFEKADKFLSKIGFDDKTINSINLAVEEIFVNIANYGYKPEKGLVNIELVEQEDKVLIIFKDTGRRFNPLSKEDPDITKNPNERSIGGLGIFMVKKIMDNMSYEYVDNHNILVISKNK